MENKTKFDTPQFNISKKKITDNFYEDTVADTHNILDITIRKKGINDNSKNFVATAQFAYTKEGRLSAINVIVDKKYRRMGIASYMYDLAEKHFGDKLQPYTSWEGKEIESFWKDRQMKYVDGGKIKETHSFVGTATKLNIIPKITGHDMIAKCDCGDKFSYQKSKSNILWECPNCLSKKHIS